MGKKGLRKIPIPEPTEFGQAKDELSVDCLLSYLYLCFTPPNVLKKGYELFCEYWKPFSLEPEVFVESLKQLGELGYIRYFCDDDNSFPNKIYIVKCLNIPLTENFSFSNPIKSRFGKPLHEFVINPFDEPKKFLKEKTRLRKRRKESVENKNSIFANKQTGAGRKKQNNSGIVFSSTKDKSLQETLSTFCFRSESGSSEKLISVNVKDLSSDITKKFFLKSENVFICKQKVVFENGVEKKTDSFFEFFQKKICLFKMNPNEMRNHFKQGLSCNGQRHIHDERECIHSDQVMTIAKHSDLVHFNTKHSKRLEIDKTNNNELCKFESRSCKSTSNNDINFESRNKVVDVTKTLNADHTGVDSLQKFDKVLPIVARKKAKRGKAVNLEKIKTQYVNERKARASANKKRKNLSEEDVWKHIKSKSLDLFSPQVDREELLKILALPKKSIIRKELIIKLGEAFSNIYFAYRQKLSEVSRTSSNYSIDFGENRKYSEKAAEACIRCGVTPQFVVQHLHEIRSRFSPDLKYIPLNILSNASMIDSAASAYFGRMETTTHGNEYEQMERLHPFLRQRLEKAGFNTREYSDNFLMTIQISAINIVEGHSFFVSSDVKEMVFWAAKNVFSGKSS